MSASPEFKALLEEGFLKPGSQLRARYRPAGGETSVSFAWEINGIGNLVWLDDSGAQRAEGQPAEGFTRVSRAVKAAWQTLKLDASVDGWRQLECASGKYKGMKLHRLRELLQPKRGLELATDQQAIDNSGTCNGEQRRTRPRCTLNTAGGTSRSLFHEQSGPPGSRQGQPGDVPANSGLSGADGAGSDDSSAIERLLMERDRGPHVLLAVDHTPYPPEAADKLEKPPPRSVPSYESRGGLPTIVTKWVEKYDGDQHAGAQDSILKDMSNPLRLATKLQELYEESPSLPTEVVVPGLDGNVCESPWCRRVRVTHTDDTGLQFVLHELVCKRRSQCVINSKPQEWMEAATVCLYGGTQQGKTQHMLDMAWVYRYVFLYRCIILLRNTGQESAASQLHHADVCGFNCRIQQITARGRQQELDISDDAFLLSMGRFGNPSEFHDKMGGAYDILADGGNVQKVSRLNGYLDRYIGESPSGVTHAPLAVFIDEADERLRTYFKNSAGGPIGSFEEATFQRIRSRIRKFVMVTATPTAQALTEKEAACVLMVPDNAQLVYRRWLPDQDQPGVEPVYPEKAVASELPAGLTSSYITQRLADNFAVSLLHPMMDAMLRDTTSSHRHGILFSSSSTNRKVHEMLQLRLHSMADTLLADPQLQDNTALLSVLYNSGLYKTAPSEVVNWRTARCNSAFLPHLHKLLLGSVVDGVRAYVRTICLSPASRQKLLDEVEYSGRNLVRAMFAFHPAVLLRAQQEDPKVRGLTWVHPRAVKDMTIQLLGGDLENDTYELENESAAPVDERTFFIRNYVEPKVLISMVQKLQTVEGTPRPTLVWIAGQLANRNTTFKSVTHQHQLTDVFATFPMRSNVGNRDEVVQMLGRVLGLEPPNSQLQVRFWGIKQAYDHITNCFNQAEFVRQRAYNVSGAGHPLQMAFQNQTIPYNGVGRVLKPSIEKAGKIEIRKVTNEAVTGLVYNFSDQDNRTKPDDEAKWIEIHFTSTYDIASIRTSEVEMLTGLEAVAWRGPSQLDDEESDGDFFVQGGSAAAFMNSIITSGGTGLGLPGQDQGLLDYVREWGQNHPSMSFGGMEAPSTTTIHNFAGESWERRRPCPITQEAETNRPQLRVAFLPPVEGEQTGRAVAIHALQSPEEQATMPLGWYAWHSFQENGHVELQFQYTQGWRAADVGLHRLHMARIRIHDCGTVRSVGTATGAAPRAEVQLISQPLPAVPLPAVPLPAVPLPAAPPAIPPPLAAKAYAMVEVNGRSSGPDSVVVMAALTLLPRERERELVASPWRPMVEEVARCIQHGAARAPQPPTAEQLAQLGELQQAVLGTLPGEVPDVKGLLDVLVSDVDAHGARRALPQYQLQQAARCSSCDTLGMEPFASHQVDISGEDVARAGTFLKFSHRFFELKTCLTNSAFAGGPSLYSKACSMCSAGGSPPSITITAMPKWLTVVLSRDHIGQDFLADGKAVGPMLESSGLLCLRLPSLRAPCYYNLRTVFFAVHGHHTVYCHAPKPPSGGKGLAAGWYYYDDRGDGRIAAAGQLDYPQLQQGEMPCSITCMLYEMDC